MSKAKYVVPVIMGHPGSELFLVKGEIPRGQTMVLVRLIAERALTSKDERGMERLFSKSSPPEKRPTRVKEVSLITPELLTQVNEYEATLVHGYINNVLPGAFRAPEISKWYIFERPGDITSLKLARFAINLLEREERVQLLAGLNQLRVHNSHSRYDPYR